MRCTIILDDPYAMAVFVAYLRKEFQVVRVKNRFENDEVEKVNVERLQVESQKSAIENYFTSSAIHTWRATSYTEYWIQTSLFGSSTCAW